VKLGEALGTTTLYYFVPNATRAQIRVGSPSGPVLIDGGPSGTADTAEWVSEGLTFYLQDTSNGVPGTTVDTIVAHLVPQQDIGDSSDENGFFVAWPNPIPMSSSGTTGQTTLSYCVPGAKALEIRVDSPSGPLLVKSGSSGTAQTANWVVDGMTFYLQDVSDGEPGRTAKTVTAHLASQ
jgi:hypothetical protein